VLCQQEPVSGSIRKIACQFLVLRESDAMRKSMDGAYLFFNGRKAFCYSFVICHITWQNQFVVAIQRSHQITHRFFKALTCISENQVSSRLIQRTCDSPSDAPLVGYSHNDKSLSF